jgi:hypothetical protein
MLIEILRMKLKEIKFDNGIDKTNQWPKKKVTNSGANS